MHHADEAVALAEQVVGRHAQTEPDGTAIAAAAQLTALTLAEADCTATWTPSTLDCPPPRPTTMTGPALLSRSTALKKWNPWVTEGQQNEMVADSIAEAEQSQQDSLAVEARSMSSSAAAARPLQLKLEVEAEPRQAQREQSWQYDAKAALQTSCCPARTCAAAARKPSAPTLAVTSLAMERRSQKFEARRASAVEADRRMRTAAEAARTGRIAADCKPDRAAAGHSLTVGRSSPAGHTIVLDHTVADRSLIESDGISSVMRAIARQSASALYSWSYPPAC